MKVSIFMKFQNRPVPFKIAMWYFVPINPAALTTFRRYHHHKLSKEVGKEQARSICCSEMHPYKIEVGPH
jgi:hypothetical protein